MSIPVVVAAEISANHGGSLELARDLVRRAADAGANAVKFQTYTADSMTLDLDSPEFAVSPSHELWGGRSLHSLYREAMTPWEWHAELFDLAHSLGVVPFSSPFDLDAVAFLESLDAPMYKIASLEIGDLRLVEAVAATGKPVVISTGAATLSEVDDAVAAVRTTGNTDLTLLVCTSSYPSDPSDAHIRRISLLRDRYNIKVGLSDHTLGLGVSVAAVALGATMIERHIIRSRSDGGPDSAFSLEPAEFAQLVREVDAARRGLGEAAWITIDAEDESRRLRRTLYVVQTTYEGDRVTADNVRAIRPGQGLAPRLWRDVEGARFIRSVERGTPLALEHLDLTELE